MATAARQGPGLDSGSVLVLSVGVGCVLVPNHKIPHLRVRLSLLQCGAEGPRGGEGAAPEVYASTLVQRQEVPAPRGSATGTEAARRVELCCYFGWTFLTLFRVPRFARSREEGA